MVFLCLTMISHSYDAILLKFLLFQERVVCVGVGAYGGIKNLRHVSNSSADWKCKGPYSLYTYYWRACLVYCV